MKKNKSDQLLTFFFILLISVIVSWVTSSIHLKNICSLLLFFTAFAFATINGADESGKPIHIDEIKPGVIFKLLYIGTSKEKMLKDKDMKDYNMYLLKDDEHTYFWMSTEIFPDGKYVKNERIENITAVDPK